MEDMLSFYIQFVVFGSAKEFDLKTWKNCPLAMAQ